MAGKLYIGRKVRELRQATKATQPAFAQRLGISTSYLNQIENNQRPVSATVLLSLAEKFQIDIGSLSTGDNDRLLSALSRAQGNGGAPCRRSFSGNGHSLRPDLCFRHFARASAGIAR